MRGSTAIAALALMAATPCAAQSARTVAVPDRELGVELTQWLATRPAAVVQSKLWTGLASFYNREIAGHRTASGETCDPEDFTAAHRTFPFGGRVRVTNLATGLSTIVRINDRGPFRGNRVIDLSYAAARAIGMDRMGTGQVSLALLGN